MSVTTICLDGKFTMGQWLSAWQELPKDAPMSSELYLCVMLDNTNLFRLLFSSRSPVEYRTIACTSTEGCRPARVSYWALNATSRTAPWDMISRKPELQATRSGKTMASLAIADRESSVDRQFALLDIKAFFFLHRHCYS